MAYGRRRDIASKIKTILEQIDGGSSPYNSDYIFSFDISNRVRRGHKFIDEVNDFPSVSFALGTETRIYNDYNNVNAELDISIWIYVNSATPNKDLEKLSQDIEHVLDSASISSDTGIMDIDIDIISNDEGLLAPIGFGELFITVLYQLEH